MDETLPLEQRRKLLDAALQRLKSDRPSGAGDTDRHEPPGHPGEGGDRRLDSSC